MWRYLEQFFFFFLFLFGFSSTYLPTYLPPWALSPFFFLLALITTKKEFVELIFMCCIVLNSFVSYYG